MKKFKHFSAAIICMFLVCAISPAYGRAIDVKFLPAPAKTFLRQNFPNQKIVFVDRQFKEYEVFLANGTKVEFDTTGRWNKVNCKKKAVPAHLVPQFISKYVKANHANLAITKINKERNGYEVELSNDLELHFSKTGELLYMD